MSPVLTWAFVILSFVSVARSFNCKNTGDVCLNNAECSFFGKCTCLPGFQGYNCGLDSALISNSTVCKVTCQNKGLCYNTNKCYCTADYIGDKCEKPVDTAVCKMNSMVLCSYRPLGFIGEMFLSDSMQHCKLKEVITDVPGYKKYELEVQHVSTGNCNLHESKRETTGEIVYSTDMATSHEKGKYGLLDTVTKMECTYPDMEVGTAADISRQRAVQMEILNDNYEPITQIDQQKQIVLRFLPPATLTNKAAVRVTHLEVFVVDAQNKVTSTVLIENECQNQQAETRFQASVTNESEQYGKKWAGIVRIKAFTFYEKDPLSLRFLYRVKFCKTKCFEKSCRSPIPPKLPPPRFVNQGLPVEVVL